MIVLISQIAERQEINIYKNKYNSFLPKKSIIVKISSSTQIATDEKSVKTCF